MIREQADGPHETTLEELLGTYLQVSARYAPPSYSLRSVASAFGEWAAQQPVCRLANVYDHLVQGRLDPNLDELTVSSAPHQ